MKAMKFLLVPFLAASMLSAAGGCPSGKEGEETAPRVRYRVEPGYTKIAKKKKVEGLMAVSFVINTFGNTEQIRVVRGLGWGLDENAIAAVSRWVFCPATKDGQPVAVPANADFTFNLL